MKRVAIPVFQGRLSEFFGECNHYEIFEIEGNTVKNIEIDIPPYKDFNQLTEWAASKKITDIITYKIDRNIISLFIPSKINLFIGVRSQSPKILIEDYLTGNLISDKKIINEIIG